MSAPIDQYNRLPCQWSGGSCGVSLDDVSPAGITRHLKDFHFPASNPWNNRRRIGCLWGGNCHSEMNCENVGKHVASVHIQSTAKVCEGCGKPFARSDTLRRHQVENCTGFA